MYITEQELKELGFTEDSEYKGLFYSPKNIFTSSLNKHNELEIFAGNVTEYYLFKIVGEELLTEFVNVLNKTK